DLRVLRRPTGDVVAVAGTAIGPGTPRDRFRHAGPAGATPIWYGDATGLVAAWKLESTVDGTRTIFADADGRILERVSIAQYDYSSRASADAGGEHRPVEPVADFAPHPTGVPDGSYPGPIAPSLVTIAGLNHPGGGDVPDPWLPPNSTETVGNN